MHPESGVSQTIRAVEHFWYEKEGGLREKGKTVDDPCTSGTYIKNLYMVEHIYFNLN
jgi:hypothetical protein